MFCNNTELKLKTKAFCINATYKYRLVKLRNTVYTFWILNKYFPCCWWICVKEMHQSQLLMVWPIMIILPLPTLWFLMLSLFCYIGLFFYFYFFLRGQFIYQTSPTKARYDTRSFFIWVTATYTYLPKTKINQSPCSLLCWYFTSPSSLSAMKEGVVAGLESQGPGTFSHLKWEHILHFDPGGIIKNCLPRFMATSHWITGSCMITETMSNMVST